MLIRKDLSTYEANATKKVDLIGKTQQVLSTMKLRLDRIGTMADTGPRMNEFLGDILADAQKI